MQRNPRYFSGKAPVEDAYEFNGYAYDSSAGAYYNYGTPAPPAFPAPVAGHEHHDFPAPINNVEFQPSETCPRNFVIFDQTYQKSRVMFHPSLAHKFGSPGFDVYGGTHAYEAGKSAYRDNDEETEDIDALLSSEEGEDDDVVSTGRTPGSWAGNSPDTACSSQSKSTRKNQVSGGSGKRDKMKKMVKTLKGIIPGGDRMDTPAVLDEAVKYLKSLKVEVKKLGMKNN
ncbi:transcription factor bHLH144-like [Canna indica]|uniref:Transcription factor bHLH144-like n=1 Tax=Canna indica TaxID=4628 RepID=A0AAQ3Q5I4_9LILI|nr:transcription factor bHLH144-like [Canna indica]